MHRWIPLLALALAQGTAAQSLFDYAGPDRMERIAAAAKKEGTLTIYTTFAEKDQPALLDPFEAKYGVKVVVWRAGTDKVLQRTVAEARARKYSVDVIHFGAPEMEALSREKILQAVTSPVHKDLHPGSVPAHREWAATLLSVWVQAYNTNLVRREDLPKTYADLLDPKWKGKIAKGHPSYSGAILTATYEISRDLGWDYFEKLAQQKVLQLQSAAEPPRKISEGERAVQADGNDYSLELYKAQGRPVEAVYATEGTPQIVVETGIPRGAPNANAARLFQHFLYSVAGQQIFIDFAHRSFHSQVKDRPGRPPLSAIKTMRADPAAVEAQSEEIKAHYAKIFGV